MSDDLEKVTAILKRVGEIDSIAPDQDFYQAGIDSMRGMDVMLDLESEFDVSIADDQFVNARTPNALVALIERTRGG
jgi:acyl carrier protein